MAERQKSCAEDSSVKEIFFRTSGRLNRWRYFTRRIIIGVLTYIFLMIGYKVLGYEYGQVTTAAGIYNGVVSIIFLIPIFCLTVRRLQDMNRGKLLAFVYVVMKIIMAFSDMTFTEFKYMESATSYFILTLATFSMMLDMYFMISPGTYGRNKYGADPLELKKSAKVSDTKKISEIAKPANVTDVANVEEVSASDKVIEVAKVDETEKITDTKKVSKSKKKSKKNKNSESGNKVDLKKSTEK